VEEPMVEYNPELGARPFVLHIGKVEEVMSLEEFRLFYADMEDAAQDYEMFHKSYEMVL